MKEKSYFLLLIRIRGNITPKEKSIRGTVQAGVILDVVGVVVDIKFGLSMTKISETITLMKPRSSSASTLKRISVPL
ncbi:MAG: hypothetical protein ACFE9L_08015 [Candidatus Hodarchaeota archaeon]